MNAQQRLAHLLEIVETPTGRSITISDIESVLTPLDFAIVRMTLKAATMPAIPDGASETDILIANAIAEKMQDATAAMRGGGLLLSSPERQAMIDQLATAGNWSNEVRDSVKTLGVIRKPRWQSEGYAAEPTLESVQAELDNENRQGDETRHEVLLSVNRGIDGTLRVMARVTPVEFAEGVELRRGSVQTLVNDAALIAALAPIIEGLTDG